MVPVTAVECQVKDVGRLGPEVGDVDDISAVESRVDDLVCLQRQVDAALVGAERQSAHLPVQAHDMLSVRARTYRCKHMTC